MWVNINRKKFTNLSFADDILLTSNRLEKASEIIHLTSRPENKQSEKPN